MAENVEIQDRNPVLAPREVFLSLAGRYRLGPEEAGQLVLASREATPADWEAAIEESVFRETGALLCHHLREAGIDPPKILQAEYKWIALSNTMIEAELRRLAPELQKAGVRILLIKGTALHRAIYKNPGLRNFEDSDWVLAGHSDWEAAKRELGALGYRPSGQGDGSRWKLGPFIIEFHRNALGDERVSARLTGLGTGVGRIDDEIWARALPAEMGEPYLMPSPEDHLLILCAHLMKHNFEPGIWFSDLEAVLAETPGFDWEAALDRAGRWGFMRHLAFSFRNLGALDERAAGGRENILPPEVREKLRAVPLSIVDRFLLAIAGRGDKIPGEKKEWVRPPLANLFWLFSQRTLLGKFQLLWEAAFPRNEVMADIYPEFRSRMRWWFMARRGPI
jgi:hypothetical protein